VPDLWQELEPAYRRALAGETVSNIQVSTPRADDSAHLRHWLASYYPVRVGGEIIGVGNVVADITELKEARDKFARNLDAMVNTIATTVEYRDPYTAGHQRKVAQIAAAIAVELGLDAHEVDGIRTAASIHDLGKISIPAEILTKPGKLSAIEYELIKQHAEAGYSIVAGIDFPWPVAEMIRQHHERLDGSGYPHGRRDKEILLGAQVIAVADMVEAITAYRPYRPGWGVGLALDQIERERGTRLHTDAVDACLELVNTRRLTLG
jgi:putative nucleotidyltransferase with HDIG domain